MAVSNLGELGPNIQKIIKRLVANQDLLKLLYYTDMDPLSQPDLTEEQIKKEIYSKLIKFIPKSIVQNLPNSYLIINVVEGDINQSNDQIRDINIVIEVYVPIIQWIIKNDNLRPFAIMGKILEILNQKTINGFGKIQGGDFEIGAVSEEMTLYLMHFKIQQYE